MNISRGQFKENLVLFELFCSRTGYFYKNNFKRLKRKIRNEFKNWIYNYKQK
jgi:hypothetical protein